LSSATSGTAWSLNRPGATVAERGRSPPDPTPGPPAHPGGRWAPRTTRKPVPRRRSTRTRCG
jgi:hypothetical protein